MIGFAEHECQGRPEALLARQEHRNDRRVRPAGERHGADMRVGNIALAHARSLREDEELVPLAQHAERRFHGMDIVGLAVDRESAELCNEPAEHAVRKQLFFCHRAENALLMRADDHPDRVGKRAVIAADDGGAVRNIFKSAYMDDRMREAHEDADGPEDCVVEFLRKTAHTVTFFRMSFKIASMLSCSVMPEVSSSTASSAGRSGAMARLESRSSRAIRSARTAS